VWGPDAGEHLAIHVMACDGGGGLVEASHEEWITLEAVGPGQVLVHHGTGERRRIAFNADLVFHNRLAVVVPTGNQSQAGSMWVNQMFTKSLQVQVVHDGHKLAVFDKDLNKSIWRDTLSGRHTVATFSLPTTPEFTSEMYFFHLAPCGKVGGRVFFSIPYFQNFIFRPLKHNRWICKNLPRWVQALEELGITDSVLHFVCSRKALDASAKHSEHGRLFQSAAAAAQEYGASALAMVSMVALWACSSRQATPKQNEAAGELLQHLLSRVFRDLVFQVPFVIENMKAVLQFNSGKCCLLQQQQQQGQSVSKKTKVAWESLADLAQEVPVRELLLQMHRMCSKSWRSQKQGVKQCIKKAFVEFARAFHNLVEDADPEAWRTSDPLGLPVMRVGSNTRARRVSKFLKQALVVSTHSGSVVRQPNHLVASLSLWNRKQRLATHTLSNTAAKNCVQDFMLNYLATLRKTFSQVRHCSISLDGFRVSGRDMLLLAFFDLGSEQACWLPPQATLPLSTQPRRVQECGSPVSDQVCVAI